MEDIVQGWVRNNCLVKCSWLCNVLNYGKFQLVLMLRMRIFYLIGLILAANCGSNMISVSLM